MAEPGFDVEAALQAYYRLDKERDRLSVDLGRLEWLRTVEVVGRVLPAPPATVADIGGGPGRYTDWLVELGYRVVHRDVVPHHVDQVLARHGAGGGAESAVGDARALDLADASVDAVLLLGPLYHLPVEADRVAALAEARRVVRPGGPVLAAAISRWSLRMGAVLVKRQDRDHPATLGLLDEAERTGVFPPVVEGGFTGYGHRPDQLLTEVAAAGLITDSLVGLEGMASALADLGPRLDDPEGRALVLDSLRAVESVPELLGASPHLLVTAHRSA